MPVETAQVVTSVVTAATAAVTATSTRSEVATPEPTAQPTVTAQPLEEEEEVSMSTAQPLTITILYDNYPFDERLKSAWGFSALVEYHNHQLLFDTGGDGYTLMEHMRILGIEPAQIDSVVLSHPHGDHTGGLRALLSSGATPVVYLGPSFSASFKQDVERFTMVNDVTPGMPFAEGLFSTGEMGGSTPEQALVIQTEQGLIVMTGCAHPGVVAIVEKAKELFSEPVRLVMGGFHLGSKTGTEITSIIEDFRRLEVELVAPCHCTGETAIRMFAAEYGEDFLQVGVGKVVLLDDIGSK